MSVFRDVLLFLNDLGVYDVVLPLLLIFSMVFAILEKTRIFGVEKMGDKEVTRKNINAMIAFVSAFFVVASAQLVATIHKLVADVALLMVTFVMFMILVGIFHKDESLFFDDKSPWKSKFMWIAFISIILIFFNALGWLMPAYYYLAGNWNSTFAATIILFIVMLIMIGYIARGPAKAEKSEE